MAQWYRIAIKLNGEPTPDRMVRLKAKLYDEDWDFPMETLESEEAEMYRSPLLDAVQILGILDDHGFHDAQIAMRQDGDYTFLGFSKAEFKSLDEMEDEAVFYTEDPWAPLIKIGTMIEEAFAEACAAGETIVLTGDLTALLKEV